MVVGGNLIRIFVHGFEPPCGLEPGVTFIRVVYALYWFLLNGDDGAGGARFKVLTGVGVAQYVHGALFLIDKSLPKRRGRPAEDRILIVVILVHEHSYAYLGIIEILAVEVAFVVFIITAVLKP